MANPEIHVLEANHDRGSFYFGTAVSFYDAGVNHQRAFLSVDGRDKAGVYDIYDFYYEESSQCAALLTALREQIGAGQQLHFNIDHNDESQIFEALEWSSLVALGLDRQEVVITDFSMLHEQGLLQGFDEAGVRVDRIVARIEEYEDSDGEIPPGLVLDMYAST